LKVLEQTQGDVELCDGKKEPTIFIAWTKELTVSKMEKYYFCYTTPLNLYGRWGHVLLGTPTTTAACNLWQPKKWRETDLREKKVEGSHRKVKKDGS
jgi:hypothetical protein